MWRCGWTRTPKSGGVILPKRGHADAGTAVRDVSYSPRRSNAKETQGARQHAIARAQERKGASQHAITGSRGDVAPSSRGGIVCTEYRLQQISQQGERAPYTASHHSRKQRYNKYVGREIELLETTVREKGRRPQPKNRRNSARDVQHRKIRSTASVCDNIYASQGGIQRYNSVLQPKGRTEPLQTIPPHNGMERPTRRKS